MPTTDYSKWQGMQFDDDDDDDNRPRRPRVTKLDGPTRITMGDDLSFQQPATASAAPVPHTTLVASAKAPSKRDGLDYSKWDKFVVDDSDDEGPDDDAGSDSMGSYPAETAEGAESVSAWLAYTTVLVSSSDKSAALDAVALADFTAEAPVEMSITEGERLAVLHGVEPPAGWKIALRMTGDGGGTTKGLVPEFTIRAPMKEQLEQMADALRARIEES